MGRVGRGPSLRAIAAALDGGITHFDVARLYGYGEAETLVGEALKTRRDKVVIASKFGLSAPRRAGALKALKPVAQHLAARVPGARAVLRSLVGGAAQGADRFSLASAQAALEESLAALKTDYLDIWLLHDCAAADLTAELKDFLDAQIASGKIRAYGAASDIDTVAAMHAVWGDALLYQFPNGLTQRNAERLPPGNRRFICHSPFAGGACIAIDDPHAVMLAYALAAPGVAVVVCSMLDETHLAANLSAVENPRFTAAEIAEIAARLAGRVVRTPAA